MRVEDLEKICNYLRVWKDIQIIVRFDIPNNKIWYFTPKKKFSMYFISQIIDEMREQGVDI